MAPSISPSRSSDFLECLLRIDNVGLRHARILPATKRLGPEASVPQIRICNSKIFPSRDRKQRRTPSKRPLLH